MKRSLLLSVFGFIGVALGQDAITFTNKIVAFANLEGGLQPPAQPTEAERKKVEETKAKAETGDAQAQGDLGNCYYVGDGVTKDVVEAAKWFRKAAEQGNARGENGLGLCYYNGNGVTKDVVEAVKWFRKAAAQGYAKAQFNLGNCYCIGDGVTKDVVEAVKLYRKAAEQGYAPGQLNLGVSYQDSDGGTKDPVEAVKWFRKAAEQGYAPAQDILGKCYRNGDGVTKDPVEAVKWFRKSAEQGYADAQCLLGDCYHDGDGVTKDVVEAVKLYRKAAEQGDPSAKSLDLSTPSDCALAACRLGICYYKGDGVSKDVVEAEKWFRKAAAQGVGLAGEAANLIETNRNDLAVVGQMLVTALSERSYYRGVEPGQDPIIFTNKIVTFTNLQGRAYRDVRLVRADLIGIIYREAEGIGGGHVSYTNLPTAFLESLGISNNWITVANAKADRRAAANAAYEQRVQQQLREESAEKALAYKLASLERNINAKVIQVTADGALIDIGYGSAATAVLLSDYPKQLIDGTSVQIESFQDIERRVVGGGYKMDRVESSGLKAYDIGVYHYTTVSGAGATIRHFTCSRAKAVAYADTLPLQDAP